MLDPKYIISLQGREFVRYEGLLNLAHERGLVGIRTTLLQTPSEENKQTAICFAEVTFRNPETGVESVFTGIGDASPSNVSRNIVPHAIRMAETRSKARALRDATNVGMTAFEELDSADLGKDIGDAPRESRTLTLVQSDRAKASRPAEPEAAPTGAKLASRSQIDQVTKEMKRTGFSQEQGRSYLMQHFAKSSRLELTGDEIEQFLQHLKGLPAADEAANS